MNELSVITHHQLPDTLTLTDEEIERTRGYATNAHAESTRAAYTADMQAWSNWALARGACPLPASPAVLAVYLTHLADSGRKAAGIGRAAASIAYHHRQVGIDPLPTSHEVVRQTMRGVRRIIGTAPTKKHAATADIVLRMLAQCDESLIGRRDRALIAVGMAGAFRRSELIALTTDDVEHTKEGVLITIRRSKGDQEGSGQVVSLPHGHHIRPVEALTLYLDMAGISDGVLFRSVALGGRLGGPMLGNAVARITKKLIARAGLDPTVFSAHSLRSGFLSSAAEHNASVFKMQEQSRHRSLDVLSGYVRSKNRFNQHAGSGFL